MIGLGLSLGSVSLRGGGGAVGLPVPTALQMSNRVNQPGFNGYAFSDGVDLNSNTRSSHFNETGASVTKLKLYFANWLANATNEQAGFSAFTLSASVEYPAGTFNQVLFGSASSTSVAIDALVATDELTLSTPIPAGAQFWVRVYVSVTSGNKWPLAYHTNTATGEAKDFGSGVDKTLSGTITNATNTTTRRGYGPIGIKATAWTGTIVKRAFASVGDSILMQSGDGNFDTKGSGGWNGRALSGQYPHANFAISGTQLANNLAANFTRRMAALQAIGITDILCDYSHNDLAAARTVAQIQGDLATIWAYFISSGFRVHHTTSLPRTSGTYLTAAGQTVSASGGGFAGGTSSRRHLLNVWLRTNPAPLSGMIDISNALDVDASNSLSAGGGFWLSGNGGVGASSTHLTTSGVSTDGATSDGLHPNVTGVNTPFYGGHYILKDVFTTYLAGLGG